MQLGRDQRTSSTFWAGRLVGPPLLSRCFHCGGIPQQPGPDGPATFDYEMDARLEDLICPQPTQCALAVVAGFAELLGREPKALSH